MRPTYYKFAGETVPSLSDHDQSWTRNGLRTTSTSPWPKVAQKGTTRGPLQILRPWTIARRAQLGLSNMVISSFTLNHDKAKRLLTSVKFYFPVAVYKGMCGHHVLVTSYCIGATWAMQYGRGRRHHCLHHTARAPNQKWGLCQPTRLCALKTTIWINNSICGMSIYTSQMPAKGEHDV